MSTLPGIQIVGTLTADPDLKFTNSGKAYASITIACNTRKKDGDQWVDGEPTFVRGTIWGEIAEHAAESLTKGTRVIAFGDLKQSNWEKDGQKRSALELQVDEIGPSLRWATAKVSKVERNGARQPAMSGGGSSDPWGAAPAAADGWG